MTSLPAFIQTDDGEYINMAHVVRFKVGRNMLNNYSAEAQLVTGDWVAITTEAETELDAYELFSEKISLS